MLQSTSESEERNFDDIQRALDIEHTVKALEAQLCYDQHSPEEVARQILKAACKSAEFLDRWVQAVRHGKPMIVPDAEEVKNTYPAEYNLY